MPRLSTEQREEILVRWKCGESQNSIAKRFPCSVQTVNNICKGVPQDNVDIVDKKVQLKQELAGKLDKELDIIDKIVDERTRHLNFFTNSALRNQQLANEALEKKTKDEEEPINMMVLDTHARLTGRNKETVLGKSPETAVQINNDTTHSNPVIQIVRDDGSQQDA